MPLFCMHRECEHSEHYGKTDKIRLPGLCKLDEAGKDILIVSRWVSVNLVELHKWYELFPTCAMVKIQSSNTNVKERESG